LFYIRLGVSRKTELILNIKKYRIAEMT
jgi:hypothetical protein